MSKKMIPLHVADQAVAACEAEIQKLREENAALKAEVERLKVAEDAVKAYHEDDVNGFLTLCAIWHDAKEGKPKP